MRCGSSHGIEPEAYDYRGGRSPTPGYALRPEIVESTYYLSHFTHDAKYLAMGRTLFRDFVNHCRTDAGYAALADVVTKKKKDRMESFVLAETFKYFYLLFAPDTALDFDAGDVQYRSASATRDVDGQKRRRRTVPASK